MAARVRVFFVDCARQHLNGAQEERAVLLRRFLQVIDELFQVVGHRVEGLRQFAKLCAALQAHAMGEVTPGNGAAGFGQHVQRRGQASRRPDAHKDAERNRDQCCPDGVPLHVRDVHVGFFLGLLRHHRPTQPRHGEVCSQHGQLGLSFLHRVIHGDSQRGQAFLLHKIPHQLVEIHVLAGCVAGAG